jgi:tetratricopeptide (TPR) repeat protein
LKKVKEGPQAFMAWASEHSQEIDQEFINILRKMVEYTEATQEKELSKVFKFLESCFCKMFPFPENTGNIAICKENYKQHTDKAIQLLKQGKARDAIYMFQTLSFFLAHHPELPYEALLSANMGIAYAQLNLKEKAIQCLTRASELSMNDVDKEKVLANLGTLCRDLKEFDKALLYYQKALEISVQRQDKEMQINHLNSLAIVQLDTNYLAQSLVFQEKAYALAKELEERAVLQDCTTRLALITALIGQTERSKELCSAGLKLNPAEP